MTPEEQADFIFLLGRAMQAGKCSFRADRETGISSNSIVGIAYGLIDPEDQELPSDKGDQLSCCLMWRKLPRHRKTKTVRAAMARATKAVV